MTKDNHYYERAEENLERPQDEATLRRSVDLAVEAPKFRVKPDLLGCAWVVPVRRPDGRDRSTS